MSSRSSLLHLMKILSLITVTVATKQVNKSYDLMPQLFKFDDFHHCLHHKEDSSYCVVTLKLLPENPANATGVWKIIQDVSSNENNYQHDLLARGLCLLNCENCSHTFSKRVDEIYRQKFNKLGLKSKLQNIHCETKTSNYKPEKLDYVFALVVLLYFAFVFIVFSTFELIKHKFPEKYIQFSKTPLGEVLTCFSISQNWHILTEINPKDYKSDFVPSMQGVRFLCSVWIIYVHTTMTDLAIPLQNPEYAEEIPYRFIANYNMSGGVLVQIFFVLSAWLLMVSLLEKLKKTKTISLSSLLLFIFGKYFRLIPLLALVVGLHSTWLIHYARSPFWDLLIGEERRLCRKKWWMNLLFINNFFTLDGWCLIQSWYMAAEFQLFVVGSVVFWFLQKKPQRMLLVSGGVIAVYTVVLFGYLFWKNVEINIKFVPRLMYNLAIVYTPEWNFSWTSTYMSVPGFAVGACFGYIFGKYKGQKLFTNKRHIVTMWVLVLAMVPLPLLFYTSYMLTDYYSNSRWFAAIYGSLYKPVFSTGIGLMLFGMSQGLGGFLKKVFEYPFFHIMAQLSYGAFVVHFTIAKVNTALKMYPAFMTDYIMFGDVLLVTSMSYMVSLFLTVMVQMPFTILSKKVLYMLK